MDHLHKQILSFQKKSNDYLDDPRGSVGMAVRNAVQRLEDDVQVQKNPRSIDDQLKRVIQALDHAEKHEAMSPHHARYLAEQCEEFRREVRKM